MIRYDLYVFSDCRYELFHTPIVFNIVHAYRIHSASSRVACPVYMYAM